MQRAESPLGIRGCLIWDICENAHELRDTCLFLSALFLCAKAHHNIGCIKLLETPVCFLTPVQIQCLALLTQFFSNSNISFDLQHFSLTHFATKLLKNNMHNALNACFCTFNVFSRAFYCSALSLKLNHFLCHVKTSILNTFKVYSNKKYEILTPDRASRRMHIRFNNNKL